MKKYVLLVVVGALSGALVGCDSDSTATTKPSPYAAYQPSSGQNLAPGIAPYSRGDPDWPMDAGNGGGGGGGGRR